MSCGIETPLEICKGKTFEKVFRWGQARLAYRTILSAAQTAPMTFVTATNHDMPDGWPYRIQGAEGMVGEDPQTGEAIGLNTKKGEYREAIVVDPTTIEVNEIDATDFSAYVASSAQLVYNIPFDMTGMTARMHVRETVDSEDFILELTTANGRIEIDNTAKTITLLVDADDTEPLQDLVEGVYELEMIDSGGKVYQLAFGTFTITDEVTHP